MNTPAATEPVFITPAQLAAVEAGGGYAEFIDPETQTTYAVERVRPFKLTPEGERKLQEGIDAVNRGDVVEWDLEAMKREIDLRAKQRQQQV